jgi:type VI secretion system secreted protein VgrG
VANGSGKTESVYTIEGGAIPPGTEVSGFRGTEGLSRLYRIEAALSLHADAAEALELSALVGTRATLGVRSPVAIGSPSTGRSLHGLIAAAEWLDATTLKIEMAPRLWLSSLDLHSRVFVDKSFPDILQAVLKLAGLTSDDYALRLERKYKPLAHVCQYRESHYAFLARWMERLGIYYYFDHDALADREQLIVVDSKSSHARLPAHPVSYFATAPDDWSDVEALWTLTHRRTAAPATVHVKDYVHSHPTLHVAGDATSALPGHGDLFWSHQDGATTAADATKVAKLRAEHLQSGNDLYVGEGRVFDLHTGFTFALDGHPRDAFNREYLVTELVHHGGLAAPHAEPGGAPFARDIYHVTAVAIRSDVQYRPPSSTPTPRIDSVEMATVDGPIESEYAQLDEAGSYLVRLHFDENANADGKASTRVRMLQPHAGAPEGFHFPLRKGTEVMVVFLGGDPDRPLIAAAVPNAATVSPVVQANHTQNVLHTGGDNRLEIEDSADDQYIDLYSPPKNTFIHLGKHHPHGPLTHAPHNHNSIASTDGDGLIHQGSDQDIMVDSNKTEDVVKAVTEKYDDTQTTNVKLKVTETYHATQTTTVDAHVEEKYLSHTTEVTGHKIETCASQDTTVSVYLDEHHGTQSTTVDALLHTQSTNHTSTVTNTSAQFYKAVTYNVGGGGFTVKQDSYFFIDAPNYTVLVPRVTEVVEVVTEHHPTQWVKFDTSKNSNDEYKISLTGTAISLIGIKLDQITVSAGFAQNKRAMLGFKLDKAGVNIKKVGSEKKQAGADFTLFGLKVWQG